MQFTLQAPHDACQHLNIGIGSVCVWPCAVKTLSKITNTVRSFSWQKGTRQWEGIKDEKRWREWYTQPITGRHDKRPIIACAIMGDQWQVSDIPEKVA